MALRPATDASEAQWVLDNLTTFAENVGSIVPAVFEAYARVVHPAGKGPGPHIDPVRWSDVAVFNGKTVHPEMQFEFIVAGTCFDHAKNPKHSQPGLWDQAPDDGDIPDEVAIRLAVILRAFTSTPERCFFAYWNGWGDPTPLIPSPLDQGERKAQEASRKAYESGAIFAGSPREHKATDPHSRSPAVSTTCSRDRSRTSRPNGIDRAAAIRRCGGLATGHGLCTPKSISTPHTSEHRAGASMPSCRSDPSRRSRSTQTIH